MTESSNVSYSMEANASPAAERKAIIVSSLNLGDNLGTAFPFRCINSQLRIGFKWLNLSDSSWLQVDGTCGHPLRVWKAARQECPLVTTTCPSWEGACRIPTQKVTNNDWENNICPFLSCSLGLRTATQWGWVVSWMVFQLVGVGAIYTAVRNYIPFFPRQLC